MPHPPTSVRVPALRPLKQLRILRVLRPLRLLSRNEGMKLIITSLVKAMPAVGNVFGVICAFQLVFAILGMQLFMGTFAACTDPSIKSSELCFAPPAPPPLGGHGRLLHGGDGGGGRLDGGGGGDSSVWLGGGGGGDYGGEGVGGADGGWGGLRAWRRLKGGGGKGGTSDGRVVWANPPYGSFDDFGQSMLTLYVMSTGDGWDAVMFSGMDATQVESALHNYSRTHRVRPYSTSTCLQPHSE